jgi:hypothetical protein
VRSTSAVSIAALANPPHGSQVSAGRHAITYRGERLSTADEQTWEGLFDGEFLTGARFPIRPGTRYTRIVVTDDRGRKAWSNPLWLDV